MSDACEQAPAHVGRRYVREMGIAGLVYAVALVASVYVVRHLAPPQWVAVMLALASAAPALLMMRAYLRRLQGLDEFQRRVEQESLAIAAAVVAFASFTYGFLHSFAGLPLFDDAMMWVFPALGFCWGVARIFVRRRYQ